jgi:hypothetical protein
MTLVRLINMCLNEMLNKVHIGEQLSDNIPIQSDLKQGDALLQPLFECAIRKV